jgi:hypothetical protein
MTKEQLIDKILDVQKKSNWTRKRLREFSVDVLKVIYEDDWRDYCIMQSEEEQNTIKKKVGT